MENGKDKDFILEEISEYYSKEPDFTEEEAAIASKTEDCSPTAPTHVQNTENTGVTGETASENISESNAQPSSDAPNDKLFYILSAAIAFSVLLSVFLTGILCYKNEEDINFKFSHMQSTSSKYAGAQEKINLTNEEISVLEDELSEIRSELNTITEYESNTGVIKSKQNVLKTELDDLNSTITSKEKALSDIENSIRKKLPSMLTLTPGLYTVGENLLSGSYSAVGDGAIVVSSSAGSAIVNTMLTSEAASFTLNDGDIVKLGTKAVFNRINKEQ